VALVKFETNSFTAVSYWFRQKEMQYAIST